MDFNRRLSPDRGPCAGRRRHHRRLSLCRAQPGADDQTDDCQDQNGPLLTVGDEPTIPHGCVTS